MGLDAVSPQTSFCAFWIDAIVWSQLMMDIMYNMISITTIIIISHIEEQLSKQNLFESEPLSMKF